MRIWGYVVLGFNVFSMLLNTFVYSYFGLNSSGAMAVINTLMILLIVVTLPLVYTRKKGRGE